MEAKGAHPDLFHEITRRQQLVWAEGDTICSLTPVFTRPAYGACGLTPSRWPRSALSLTEGAKLVPL
jgi:hypothetical protein